MKKILVTGAAGQIGSELVPALRERYGSDNVIAAGNRTQLPEYIRESGPYAMVDVGEADGDRLSHRTDFNVSAMSFISEELAEAIKMEIPEFRIDYNIDPVRQKIADSWPDSLDDSVARIEWGWEPSYDIHSMTRDMIENLSKKLARQIIT